MSFPRAAGVQYLLAVDVRGNATESAPLDEGVTMTLAEMAFVLVDATSGTVLDQRALPVGDSSLGEVVGELDAYINTEFTSSQARWALVANGRWPLQTALRLAAHAARVPLSAHWGKLYDIRQEIARHRSAAPAPYLSSSLAQLGLRGSSIPGLPSCRSMAAALGALIKEQHAFGPAVVWDTDAEPAAAPAASPAALSPPPAGRKPLLSPRPARRVPAAAGLPRAVLTAPRANPNSAAAARARPPPAAPALKRAAPAPQQRPRPAPAQPERGEPAYDQAQRELEQADLEQQCLARLDEDPAEAEPQPTPAAPLSEGDALDLRSDPAASEEFQEPEAIPTAPEVAPAQPDLSAAGRKRRACDQPKRPVPLLSVRRPPPSRFIRVRGMPWNCAEHDLTDFFLGYNVEQVLMMYDSLGRPRGDCFVSFQSKEDAARALAERDHQEMGGRFLELFRSTEREMKEAASSRGLDTSGSLLLRLRGLPFSATEDDVEDFLHAGDVEVVTGSVHLQLGTDGRPTGQAFVRVPDDSAATKATQLHKVGQIGSRYIEVYRCSEAELEGVLKQHAALSSVIPTMAGTAGTDHIVKARGLPFAACEPDIAEFFSGLRIAREGIHLVFGPDGRPSGEAFIEFQSAEDAHAALQRNRVLMGARYVEVRRSSRLEMQGGAVPLAQQDAPSLVGAPIGGPPGRRHFAAPPGHRPLATPVLAGHRPLATPVPPIRPLRGGLLSLAGPPLAAPRLVPLHPGDRPRAVPAAPPAPTHTRGSSVARAGDWTCGACGFLCFANRMDCKNCGTRRTPQCLTHLGDL
eukprot:TRINITY_DN10373_c0_g1_i1.p1 TRINITY_DN10373_c0_g1~~TRINITY_DN10373_c0_g1_i1.p1  ORF type:complete len:804 (+),score=203.04 TRINITY_DN10373_c0_g1_i1:70-2481(+)